MVSKYYFGVNIPNLCVLMHQVGSGTPKHQFLFLQQFPAQIFNQTPLDLSNPWISSCWAHKHCDCSSRGSLGYLGYIWGAPPRSCCSEEFQTPFPTPPMELWMCPTGIEAKLKFFYSATPHWEESSPLPLLQVLITHRHHLPITELSTGSFLSINKPQERSERSTEIKVTALAPANISPTGG